MELRFGVEVMLVTASLGVGGALLDLRKLSPFKAKGLRTGVGEDVFKIFGTVGVSTVATGSLITGTVSSALD